MKFHLKSLLVGLCIGIAAILVIGAETSTQTQLGRYQLISFTGPGAQPGAMMVDTTTGKAWAVNLAFSSRNDGEVFYAPKDKP